VGNEERHVSDFGKVRHGRSVTFPLTPALSFGERIPRKGYLTLRTPEPQGRNIQHPTSNLEPPRTVLRAIIGCWAFDVGCWMFPAFTERETCPTALKIACSA
jgi:hypothetical protein